MILRQAVLLCLDVIFRKSSMLLSEEVWCMRELKYSSAEEMSEAIDKYFEDCDGHPLTDENGDIARRFVIMYFADYNYITDKM